MKTIFGTRKLIIAGIAFFLLFALLVDFPQLTSWLDFLMLDAYTLGSMPCRKSHPDIVLVGIDSQTLTTIPHRWPWPREIFADMLNTAAACRPKIIILDVVFQHSAGSQGDDMLENAIKSAGNIAMVSVISKSTGLSGTSLSLQRNAERFRNAALIEGFVESPGDSDGKVRSSILLNHNLNLKSCVLQAAEFLSVKPDLKKIDHDGNSGTIVSYGQQNGGIPVIRASDLIEKKLPVDILKDRIVVIGATAPILHDYHLTPRGSIPGPEVLASTLDTILSDRVIERDSRPLWRFLLGCLGLITGFLFSRNHGSKVIIMRLAWTVVFAVAAMSLSIAFGSIPPWSVFILSWLMIGIGMAASRGFIEFLDGQITIAESRAAGGIQHQLFPGSPLAEEKITVRGFCDTCSDAGGDYFDYFRRNDGSILFVITDVSGHGLSAAMVTMAAKTVIQSSINQEECNLINVIENMNRLVFQIFAKKKFMTAQIGLYQPQEGRIIFCSAGHIPALVVRSDGAFEEYAWPSHPLGLRESGKFKTVEIPFGPGDRMILYTDGIIEAVNWNGEMYGFERWFAFVRSQLPLLTPGAPLDLLLSDVKKHLAGKLFDDDVTLMLIENER